MKERPILFSGPMVRAILNGTKTQTRRVAKLPGDMTKEPGVSGILCDGVLRIYDAEDMGPTVHIPCPYGKSGDRLWVRETAIPTAHGVIYRADIEDSVEAAGIGAMYGGWKPSIHMPRVSSRITLEINQVRVERLQDITEEDAKAEGVECERDGWKSYIGGSHVAYAFTSFGSLWESINGPESWDANPWVWVIEFKRVKGGAE